MTYEVEIERTAAKYIAKLSQATQSNILAAIAALAVDPRPFGNKKLVGRKTVTYRVRVGDYRIVYTINDTKLVVVVVKVGHRSDVYKG